MGVNIAAHNAIKRWNFYAGLRIGVNYQYNKLFDNKAGKFYNNGTFSSILTPYAGVRYYMSKSVSLQLEADHQRGLTIGVSKKF